MLGNKLNGKLSIQRITLLAFMTALCQVSRQLLQFLPNIQPVTVILIIFNTNIGNNGWVDRSCIVDYPIQYNTWNGCMDDCSNRFILWNRFGYGIAHQTFFQKDSFWIHALICRIYRVFCMVF